MNPSFESGEQVITVSPTEEVVVFVRFTTARLDYGDARQKPPVEPILIRGADEFRRQVRHRTVKAREEGLQPFGSGVRIARFGLRRSRRRSRDSRRTACLFQTDTHRKNE